MNTDLTATKSCRKCGEPIIGRRAHANVRDDTALLATAAAYLTRSRF